MPRCEPMSRANLTTISCGRPRLDVHGFDAHACPHIPTLLGRLKMDGDQIRKLHPMSLRVCEI